MHRLATFLCGLALGATPSFASDSASAGFALTARANPGFGAVSCSLPAGEFVTFDGLSVDRWSSTGALVTHLGSLANFAYASFVEPTPDGLAVVLADSGDGSQADGHLHLARLDGSALAPLVQLTYPYAGAFLPDGALVVSAATQGWGAGNDLVRVDLALATTTIIGHVDGVSGPLAIGRSGELYYGTQAGGYSPPPGSSDVLRWSAAQVLAGGLSLQNATTVAAGFDNASALAHDPLKGRLYLAENVWNTGSYRIRRVASSAATSPTLVQAGQWIGAVRFEQLAGAATFDAYQPADGLRLVYETSDFVSFDELVTVAPARPVISASGAGLSGVGPVTLSVSGGVPNGSALLTYCEQGSILGAEASYPLPRFLYHTPFVLREAARLGFLIPTDAVGTGTLMLWNPGGMQGLYGYQFLVGRPDGVLIGSSDSLLF